MTPAPSLPALQSGLYECRVMHHRFAPREHRFAYRIFMAAVDLDELGRLDRDQALFSVNRPNLYSFREADYLPTAGPRHLGAEPAAGSAPGGLKDRVQAYLRDHGIEPPVARVVLLTLPRIAGYLFNPVSFYYCYDPQGRPVAAIVEVTNTFREVKPYCLVADRQDGGTFAARQPKFFYVSPFSDVDVAFDFHLQPLAERLAIRIDDFQADDRLLTSTLTGRRRAFSSLRLAWFAVKYPLLTLRVIALIHLHAFLLYLKGVPWFAKAARAADQREVYRPHASISPPPPA
jgi:DUF1365 family protein